MHRRSYSHSFGESNHHLQFTPKYRRPVFSHRVIRMEARYWASQKAKELNIKLVACEFGPDHMHLFVARCKNWSDAQLAQRFKGFIARKLRQRCWDILRKWLWGDSFWSDGYFHETVGSVTAQARAYYIKRCQRKHWTNREFVATHKNNQLQLTDFTAN